MKFIIRWIVATVAVGVAVWIVPGITVADHETSLSVIAICALALALLNVSIKPVIQFVSFPLTILTLGLFLLVINALMLMLAAWASTNLFGAGLEIDSFWSALLGGIIISIVTSIVNGIIAKDNAR